jgi:hypothetical protein
VVRRLATDLQQYRFVMKHIEGEKNVLADYLSRAEHITKEEYERMRQQPRGRALTPATSDTDGAATGGTSMPESTSENLSTDSEFENFDISGVVKPVIEGHFAAEDGLSSQHSQQSLDNSEGASQGSNPRRRAAPRRRRDRRQLPQALREAEDDGLAIPNVEAHPNPPDRFLSPEIFHLLHKFHGGTAPHTGVQPLVQALREAGHNWPTMLQDCRTFVTRCHLCQLERLNRRGPRCLPYRSILIPSHLFEVWLFDIIGPFHKCDLSGSQYIYVAVEQVSHLAVLDHGIEASSPELLLFMLNVFKFFGLPAIITSDVGPQFISKTIEDFCHATGIEHRFGVPYNHQSDGTVENSIRYIWSYLRLAIHDLKRYAAWTPLLMNVMLGCNSLPREVLGGASASALIFNRKVQPMRFLRPGSLRAPYDPANPGVEGEPVEVNGFIADQAAQQMRLLYFAEQTRQQRYGDQVEAQRAEMLRQEEEAQGQLLDWVRVGQLVSIPQPEHDTQLRPTKLSLRRTGPYEVMECDTTTVKLRDRRAFMRSEDPVIFKWPKRELWPYYARTQPAGEVEEIQEDRPDALHIVSRTDEINAILLSEQLRDRAHTPQTNVRNYRYLVRWEGRPHSDTSFASYQEVWHTSAFQSFYRDSGLTDHIPPTQHALAHRQHVTQLLRGDAQPAAQVPVANPRRVMHNLFDFFPTERPTYPNRSALQRAERQSQEGAAVEEES